MGLLPPVLLAVWSAFTVWDNVVAIRDYRGPVDTRIPLGSGVVRIQAQGFDLDLGNLALSVTNPKIADETGQPIASARSLSLVVGQVATRPVAVEIDGLVASLERLPDGRIRYSELLERPEEEPSEQPVEVRIRSADIRFLDRARKTPWVGAVRLRNVVYVGNGFDWTASGDGTLPGADLSFTGWADRKGAVRGSIDLREFDAAYWLAWLREGPEKPFVEPVKDLEMKAGSVVGKLSFSYSPDIPVQFRFDGALEGRKVAYAKDIAADRAVFRGSFDQDGLDGDVDAASRGAELKGRTVAVWTGPLTVSFDGEGTISSIEQLPKLVRNLIPKGLALRNAKADGSFRYMQKEGFFFQGDASANRLRWDKIVAANVSGRIGLDPKRVVVQNVKGLLFGGNATGQASAALSDGKLAGGFQIVGAQIDQAASLFGFDGRIGGAARADAILSGTLAAPSVDFRTKAFAKAKVGDVWRDLGFVEANGDFANGVVTFSRSSAAGSMGLAVLTGTVSLDQRRLDLRLFANGLDAKNLHENLAGYGVVRASVQGPFEDIEVSGRIEGYALEYANESLPFAGADFALKDDRVVVQNLTAARGSARLTGEGILDIRSSELSGSFEANGIQISDWLGSDGSGVVNLKRATLGGTLENPTIEAVLQSSGLLVRGIPLDSMEADLEATLDDVNLSRLVVVRGSGQATVTGTFDIGEGLGQAKATVENWPFDSLSTFLGDAASIDGAASASASATFDSNGLQAMAAEGTIDDGVFNNALAGSGTWTARMVGRNLVASLSVGQIERFIEVPNLKIDFDQNLIDAEIQALGLPARNLWLAARRYAQSVPDDWVARLDNLEGDVQMSARLSGPTSSPVVDVELLEANGIRTDGVVFGDFKVAGNRRDGTWTIDEAKWSGGPADFLGKGTVAEAGDIAFDGDLSNFDLRWLSFLEPRLSSVGGLASLSFVASGPTNSPQIRASASGNAFGPTDKPWPLDVLLESIQLDETGLRAEGSATYQGLVGRLLATVPFTWASGLDRDRPLSASLVLDERDADDLLEYIPTLSAEGTHGTVSGSVGLFGSVEDLKLQGSVRAKLDSLASSQLQTAFKNVDLNADWKDDKLIATLSLESQRGGSSTSSVQIGPLTTDQLMAFDFERLRPVAISGKSDTVGLGLLQDIAPKSPVQARIDAGLTLSGTIGRPTVSGNVSARQVDATVPSEFGEVEPAQALPVDPRFNVAFSLAPGSRIRASLADLKLGGSGTLGGTLSRLAVNGLMTVGEGTIRLPTARVQILPDGNVRLAYQGDPTREAFARLDVDLLGTTHVTTMGPSGLVDRYRLDLTIRGDMLAPEGLSITGSSDPPDLSQERILAIIGQDDLIRSLSAADEQALTNYAIPVLFDALTQDFATRAGLDYLSLEYGVGGSTNLTAARTLAFGTVISIRKQINQTEGRPEIFDVRLTYRPPHRIVPLRGFTLSIGADQDSPWKLSIDYRKRF